MKKNILLAGCAFLLLCNIAQRLIYENTLAEMNLRISEKHDQRMNDLAEIEELKQEKQILENTIQELEEQNK